MNYRKLLYSGVIIFLLSILLGIIGTLWNIYGSFDALEKTESAGIGAVGDGIARALIFTIVSLAGCAVGFGMMIYAGVKLRK
ncbi:MAG: MotA/TolQ/ExbB proton channel family protein [Chloracidobacterium sp.]|nr:MotA/TolQ/ExbB proton channel family protein [Chloracidobacterium sp.]